MEIPYSKQEELDLVKEIRDKCKFVDDESASTNIDQRRAPIENGRVSSGSGESAFSSGLTSDESSQLDSYNNSSSGRSSSNRDNQFDEPKLMNTGCNLEPENSHTLQLVDRVRVKFLESLKDNSKDLYEELDLIELKKPLGVEPANQEQSLAFRLITRHLDFHKISSISDNNDGNIEKRIAKEIDLAVERLNDSLKFRNHYQLSTVCADQFLKEFYILSGCFAFGHDRNNLPVLYLRACVHRKWSPKLDDMLRRCMAWQMNLLTKSYHGAKVSKSIGYRGLEKDGSFGICFDCAHVTYSCLDMDFMRFLVKILVHHYPTYCRYALCVDLPWLFRSVWKLVRSWLPQDAQSTVLLLTSKELLDYIDEDQIPNCIKFNDLKPSEKPIKNRHYIPNDYDSLKGIDDMAKELKMSTNEVKQFKAHVAKVKEDYQALGAL